MKDSGEPLTQMIREARDGSSEARERLFEAVYDELRIIARSIPHVGGRGDTMQATVLANEAYMQFERRFPLPPDHIPESRATFFRTVALAMRTILRDHWRAKTAEKRGGHKRPVQLHAQQATPPHATDPDGEAFLLLDEALERLEQFNERWYEIAMQRFFVGRSIAHTAELLDVSESTVTADWKQARAWLRQAMGESSDSA